MTDDEIKEKLPPPMKRLVGEIGVEPIKCRKGDCPGYATVHDIVADARFFHGECVSFSCPRASVCRAKTWAHCLTCKKTFGANAIGSHIKSKRHKELRAARNSSGSVMAGPTNKRPRHSEPAEGTMVDFSSLDPSDRNSHVDDQSFPPFPGAEEVASVAGMSTGALLNSMEDDLESASILNMEVIGHDDADQKTSVVSEHPRLSLKGNESLVDLLKDSEKASIHQVSQALTEMRREVLYYWVAEHASPTDRAGGGVRYMVSTAFGTRGSVLEASVTAGYPESQWQIENYFLYQSMNETQRARHSRLQSRLTQSIMGNLSDRETVRFFKNTYVPDKKGVRKLYGTQANNSIWNLLPIPPIEDVEGVAFVSPIHIVKYAFANGIPFDDFYVDYEVLMDDEDDSSKKVYHLSECQAAKTWKRELFNSSRQHCLNQGLTSAVLCWFSDWTDGFGPSRTKNNRGSVVAYTFTLSPPKEAVNSTNNTFLMAVGLKKSKNGWARVSKRVQDDYQQMSTRTAPLMVYHGSIRKMVPTYFKQFVSIEDKVERPDSTGTIASGSGVHRRFGVLGKIETPACDIDNLSAYLSDVRLGTPSNFGWCEAFVTQGNNGSKFPSCLRCRRDGLFKLGVLKHCQPTEGLSCRNCCNWDQLKNPMLVTFNPEKEYPKLCDTECPINPPKGREVGLEKLAPMRLSFEILQQAARFAYYHCSRPNGSDFPNWNKSNCLEYLRQCGFSKKEQESLYKAAVLSRTGGGITNYADPQKVGGYDFPAPWYGQIGLGDHIEAVMHLLFLGIAEDMLELGGMWMKQAQTKGVSNKAFRRQIQELLKVLKSFQMSWLLVYTFNISDEGEYRTGSWVAENWLGFVRILPIIFGWSCSNKEGGTRDGYQDLARAALSFHAVVARVMTHGGVNKALVEETELYMKEFLSSIRELDVRLRYPVMKAAKNSRATPTTSATRTTTTTATPAATTRTTPTANTNTGKGKRQKGKTDVYWLKPNFMSIVNLCETMTKFGPMTNLMDGGGKGERFIQEVKPHIKRGVREDMKEYFKLLMAKVYKTRQMSYIEQRLGLNNQEASENEEGADRVLVDLLEAVALDKETSDSDSDSDDDIEEAGRDPTPRQTTVSEVEDAGMWKKSTIYVYKNHNELNDSIQNQKPIAGILQSGNSDEYSFYAVFRMPVKKFARCRVIFDDRKGTSFHGMWYAEMRVENEVSQDMICSSLNNIREDSKMSVVAIPLWYIIGKDQEDSNKFCVISNWWKVRNRQGQYILPTLDPDMYGATYFPVDDDGEDNSNVI